MGDADLHRWRGQLGMEPAADTSGYVPKVVTLGGEHSITPALVAAAASKHRGLSVLQIDAHENEPAGSPHVRSCDGGHEVSEESLDVRWWPWDALPTEDADMHELVRRVVTLVDRAEYKRRQAPPGVRVTPKAFGKDRRLPITNRYKG